MVASLSCRREAEVGYTDKGEEPTREAEEVAIVSVEVRFGQNVGHPKRKRALLQALVARSRLVLDPPTPLVSHPAQDRHCPRRRLRSQGYSTVSVLDLLSPPSRPGHNTAHAPAHLSRVGRLVSVHVPYSRRCGRSMQTEAHEA